MKIIYTEAASRELESFKKRQIERLEEVIKERKFVFGDDELEVTASDIKEASESFRVSSRSDLRYRRTRLIMSLLRAYAIMGIFVAVGGLIYPFIQQLYEGSRIQFAWIAMGTATTVISVFMLYWFREREARFSKFIELERDLRLREIIQEVEKEANKARMATPTSPPASNDLR